MQFNRTYARGWSLFLTLMGVACVVIPSSAQPHQESAKTGVTAKVDERIELTSIVARLAGYGEYVHNQFKIYADDVDRHFAPYKHHPVVEFARRVRENNGIGFDAIPNLAVHLNPPPLLTPRVEFSAAIPDPRWGKANAEKFASLLKQFYEDAGCATFFKTHASLYRITEQRFQAPLNKVNFAWYKQFYGEQPEGTFNINSGGIVVI